MFPSDGAELRMPRAGGFSHLRRISLLRNRRGSTKLLRRGGTVLLGRVLHLLCRDRLGHLLGHGDARGPTSIAREEVVITHSRLPDGTSTTGGRDDGDDKKEDSVAHDY